MPLVDKNMLIMLGAAETCRQILREEGFFAGILPVRGTDGSRACVIVASRTAASVKRFVATKQMTSEAFRGLLACMWIYEDVTLYTTCPEVLGNPKRRRGSSKLAYKAANILHNLARDIVELIPHYQTRDAAKQSQLSLREQFSAVEPMLRLTPRVARAEAVSRRDLN